MAARGLPGRLAVAPVGYKVIAVVVAVAVAYGLHVRLAHQATQTARTARLSFDPARAQMIDSQLPDTKNPAIAFAQSILSDEAVAELSKGSYLSSFALTTRIGEFRSRLEFTQPSENLLSVRFQDPDPDRSVAETNAVAQALTDWIPRSSGDAPAAAPSQKRPPQTPSVGHALRPASALSGAITELQAQLSAANREVERLSASTQIASKGPKAHAETSSYAQAKQQQVLKTAVRSALKRLEDLRTQYAKGNPDPGMAARLGKIQQALLSILPANNASTQAGQQAGFRAAGTSASQLRRERTQLTFAIGVVNTERQAIEREEAAQAAPNSRGSSQTASSPIADPAAAATAASPQSIRDPLSQDPLRLVQPATLNAHSPLWPPLLGGVLCGLLVLVATVARHRPFEEGEDVARESAPHPQRLITPSEPVRSAVGSVNRTEVVAYEGALPQRASFTLEAAPLESRVAKSDLHVTGAESNPQVVENSTGIESNPHVDERIATTEEKAPIVVEEPAVTGERDDLEEDFVAKFRKALSETSIGKMFEGLPAWDEALANREDEGGSDTPKRPGRMAG